MDMIFNTEVSMEEAIRQFKELYNDVIAVVKVHVIK